MPPLLWPNLKVFGHELTLTSLDQGGGHTFTQTQKQSFISHKSNVRGTTFFKRLLWTILSSSAGRRRVDRVELVAGQFGCVDRDNLGRVAYEMGAFPLRDAGRVPIARMRKRRNERITVFNTTCAVCTLTKLPLLLTHKLWRLRISQFSSKIVREWENAPKCSVCMKTVTVWGPDWSLSFRSTSNLSKVRGKF